MMAFETWHIDPEERILQLKRENKRLRTEVKNMQEIHVSRVNECERLEDEIERLTTEGAIAELRNGELLAENQIMYRALDRISRSVAGSPHLVKLAREALERVSGRQPK